ncbi:MAG TPA: hypothetical protein DCO75_04310 [Fibrobacteres bacterium]|nr:hypothetical protein [Fibrobacterota bacterium]
MKQATLSCFVNIFISGYFFVVSPLSLPQAQKQMLIKNLDIVIANQDYCKKDYELTEAKSVWYPSFDASGSLSYQNKKSTITLPIYNSMEIGTNDRSDLGLEVSYPLTAAFVNTFNVKYRTMDLQIKSMQNSALKNQLSYKLAALYFSWDFSFCQTVVQQTLVSQLEAAVARIKELQAGGIASSAKVLEAQAKLENAKVALCTNENTTDSLKQELADFIQYGDSAITPENYDFKIDSLYISSINTISLDVFRPELSALDLSAEQLSVYMDILSGQKYPNLVLSAGYHYGRPELNMGKDPDYMGYAIAALKFNFNIFDGYKISSRQSQTQQQIEMVKSRKKQLTNSFVISIKSAKQDFLRAQRQKNAARISLEASHALVEDVKNSLNSGVSTTLDYLNALSSEAVAECGVKQAQFMEKMALLKIYYASGKELKY